jgi:hypothetical protein
MKLHAVAGEKRKISPRGTEGKRYRLLLPDIEGEEEKQWSCGRLLGVPRGIWYFVDVWLLYIKFKY